MDARSAIALIIFLATYAAILSEKIDKTVAALAGGCAMIVLGVIHQGEAFAAIDLSVLFLLIGMMVIVHFLAESGFFGYVAIRLAQVARGRPAWLLLLLCAVTAGLSALVDNVTTVLLITPVTFLIADQLDVSPVPYVLFEAISSNIGGTATLVGDPPNILIGSAADLSFNAFLFNLGPVSAVCVIALLAIALFVVRKQARVSADIRARVFEMKARRAITDGKLLKKTACVLGLVFVFFMLHDILEIPPASVALTGAAVLLLWTRTEPDKAFKAVDWSTVFFFIGLFIVVEGLRAAGMLDHLAMAALSLTRNDLLLTSMLLLWFSALSSSVIGAVPVVTTLIPVVHNLIPAMAGASGVAVPTIASALWWSLALGACLGGNGTMVGAAANIVVVQIARDNRYPISFGRYMRYGVPVTLVTLVISSIYVAIRYVH